MGLLSPYLIECCFLCLFLLPSLHIHHGILLSNGSGLVLNGIGVSIERGKVTLKLPVVESTMFIVNTNTVRMAYVDSFSLLLGFEPESFTLNNTHSYSNELSDHLL